VIKLSTRSRYGVRFLVDLARHSGTASLREVAEREGISEKYLWSMVPPLKNAGLISTARGAGGGCSLAKPAGKITLREVIAILDGGIRLADCTMGEGGCDRVGRCGMATVWMEIEKRLEAVLEGYSIESIVQGTADIGGYCI